MVISKEWSLGYINDWTSPRSLSLSHSYHSLNPSFYNLFGITTMIKSVAVTLSSSSPLYLGRMSRVLTSGEKWPEIELYQDTGNRTIPTASLFRLETFLSVKFNFDKKGSFPWICNTNIVSWTDCYILMVQYQRIWFLILVFRVRFQY